MDRKTKWDEWRHKWCYLRFPEALDRGLLPLKLEED
jgi:hypothetical protein